MTAKHFQDDKDDLEHTNGELSVIFFSMDLSFIELMLDLSHAKQMTTELNSLHLLKVIQMVRNVAVVEVLQQSSSFSK